MLSFFLIAATAASPLVQGAQPPSAQPPSAAVTPTRDTTTHIRADAGDVGARALLARARAARLTQDAALTAYDARTYQRFSVGLGVSAFSPERLLLRTESAAHVTWSRAAGITVEQTGSRAVMPMASEKPAHADLVVATPIPYFPGRETLWFPTPSLGVARPDVDPTSFIHPLANGSDAYYRYALGDASAIRLPDGRSIGLRELRVTPRRASPRAFVGSFWFDTASGHVVRAVYRMSVDFDLWAAADADMRRRIDSLRTAVARDTLAAGAEDRRRARARVEREIERDKPPRWFTFATGEVRATISAVTVEYGLFEGRVWLPRRSVAEGEARSGVFRMPVTLDERYRYDRVTVAPEASVVAAGPAATGVDPSSGAMPTAPVAPPTVLRTAIDSALALVPRDSAGLDSVGRGSGSIEILTDDERRPGRRSAPGSAAGRAEVDSLLRAWARAGEDLTRRADSLATRGDSAGARRLLAQRDRMRRRAAGLARREVQCASGAAFYDAGTVRRDGAGPAIHVRRPCDPTTLATSPELPRSPYDADETPLAASERAALLGSLDGIVPAAWPMRPPRLHTGLDLVRFNRIEGLSVGLGATASLPTGDAVDATVRLGVADLVPNAELGVTRTRGGSDPTTTRLAVYQRLAVANDDWVNPFGLGASLAAALYGRDEGFYYRTWGAELRRTRAANALTDPDAPRSAWWNPLSLVRGAALGWRLFAEAQRGATQELHRGAFGPHYAANIGADRLTTVGLDGELARTFGADPSRLRAVVRARGEGAYAHYASGSATGMPYARGLADVTLSQPLGPITASVTGSAGGMLGGRVPVQREFYLGGLQTVRGIYPRPIGDGYVGREFWLTRSELGFGRSTFVRPVVFFDAGRASDRAFAPGTTLTGVGAGLVFLDGLVRVEGARGKGESRFDVSLGGRF